MKKIGVTLFLAACVLACAWLLGGGHWTQASPGTAPRSGPEAAAPIKATPAGPVAVKDGPLAMRVETDNTSVLHGSNGEMLLRVELTADQAEVTDGRPLNLALVIDRSGSMADRGKLEYARQAAIALVDQLNKDDRLAVVIYDDNPELLVPSTWVTESEKIKEKISGVTHRGSTNLSGGLAMGREQVKKYFDNEAINRVIILSDGLANRGITSRDELRRLVAGWGEAGVRVTAMGLGADFDEDLMWDLANSSGGAYHFIESPSQLAGIYEKELRTLAATVAKDVTVTLNLPEGVRLGQVYGYASKVEGDRVKITVGDVASAQLRRVRVQLFLPTAEEGKTEIAGVRLDYRDALNDSRKVRSEAKVEVACVKDETKVTASRNVGIWVDREVVRISKERYDAQEHYKKGDKKKAVNWYRKNLDDLRDNADFNTSKELQGQAGELEKDLERMEQNPDGAGRRNAAKSGKLDAIGYMQ